MSASNTTTSPINSFIKYFLDIKPYHTKILEIIEKYNFSEVANISILETLNIDVTVQNDPLCIEPGTEGCDIDAEECCDLFECIGGYGILFDNSDLLVTAPILEIDNTTDTITLTGDFTYDKKFNIKSIPNANTIVLTGDVQTDLIAHKLILIANKHTYKIITTTTNSFVIPGNRVTEFLSQKVFTTYGAGENNGEYTVLQATYNISGDETTIQIAPSRTLEANSTLGYIDVQFLTKNNGAYTVANLSFNGDDTEITVNETLPFIDAVNSVFGAVQIRTGLFTGRTIDVENTLSNDDGKRKILVSNYDSVNDITSIVISGHLMDAVTAVGNVALYGYMTGAGFDGEEECSNPSLYNIDIGMSEQLSIEIHPAGWTP